MVELLKPGVRVQLTAAPSPGSLDTGAADVWGALAQSSAQITQRISRMADDAAAREGMYEGLAAGDAAGTPGGGSYAAVSGPAKPASGPVLERQKQAMAYFTGKGWSKVQAAAIIGNLMQESTLRTEAANPKDPGTSIGLGQWNRERKAGLMAFAAKRGTGWQDFATQLDFISHELDTSESGVGQSLKRATTLDDATAAFIGFERPQGWSPGNPRAGNGWSARLAYARGALGVDGGQVPVAAGAAPDAKAAPAAAGVVALPAATSPPLLLKRNGTIRGDAYDKAALSTYSDRLELSALTEIQKIADATPDDPSATASAIEDYRKQTRGQVPPELRSGFDSMVGRQALSYTQAASRLHAKKVADDADAAFLETYNAKRAALIRLAGNAGVDPKGNAALTAELQSVDDFVAGSSTLSPTAKMKLKQDLTDDVMTSRLLSAFDGRGSPEARAKFAEFLGQAYNQGEGLGKDMSPEAFQRVQAQMAAGVARDQTAALQQANATQRKIDGAMALLKGGFPIPETTRAAIKAEVASSGDPNLAAAWGFFDGLANWQIASRAQPPEQLQGQIDAYEAKLNAEGASPQDAIALDTMKAVQKSAEQGLEKDPMGWAEKVGRVSLAPLDLSSPQGFGASLAARADAAHAVAQTYGRPVRFFKAGEAKALSDAITKNPDMLGGFGPALVQSLGERDAPKALAEISKDAPVVAHVSGLALMTGDDRIVGEVATALKLRQTPGYQPLDFSKANRPPVPALRFLPATEAAATSTAELLFDMRARQRGISDPKSPEAAELWGDAMSDVMGAHEDHGRMMGGLGTVNGAQVLLPSTMGQEDFQYTLDGLRDEDLKVLPPIASASGFPVTAKQLATGHPVAVGPDRYRLALGDPDSADPKFLMAPGGGFWEFNPLALTGLGTGGEGW